MSGTARQKRIARKTVTWDENCDVVEFDRDSVSEMNPEFEESVDDLIMDEADMDDPEDNLFFQGPPSFSDDSYENSQEVNLDGEVSITNIVDAMFGTRAATPDRSASLPPDTETEDGGRSHHAERNVERQGRPLPSPQGTPLSLRSIRQDDDEEEPVTPPLQAVSSPPTSPPLGRTTHAERAQEARNEAFGHTTMPPSPSPMKSRPSVERFDDEEIIPKLDLSLGSATDKSFDLDQSFKSSVQDEQLPTVESFMSFCDDLNIKTDPNTSHASFVSASLPSPAAKQHIMADIAPLSPRPRSLQGSPRSARVSSSFHVSEFGTPELSRVGSPLGRPNASFARASSPGSPLGRSGSPLGRAESPLGRPNSSFARASSPGSPLGRSGSPMSRSGSPFLNNLRGASPFGQSGSPFAQAGSPFARSGTASPRPRLDREDLQRRMQRRKSQEDVRSRSPSVVREMDPSADPDFSLDASMDVSRDIFPRGEESWVDGEKSFTQGGASFSKGETSFVEGKSSSSFIVHDTTVESITVERLVSGTNAVSATDVNAVLREEEEAKGYPQGDMLAQAARKFAMAARKSPSARGSPALGSTPPLAHTPTPPPPPPKAPTPPVEEMEVDPTPEVDFKLTEPEEPELEEPTDLEPEEKQTYFDGLNVDFGGRFGVTTMGDNFEGSRSTRASVGDLDVDMEMQSALDQLMEDVAGGTSNVRPALMSNASANRMSRSYVSEAFKSPPNSRVVSAASVGPVKEEGPPVKVKETRKMREELILAKRREARRAREEEGDDDDASPVRPTHLGVGSGRPSRRRSMSTGDAEDIQRRVSGGMLRRPSGIGKGGELGDIINQELERREEDTEKKSKYQVREREVIYASSDVERVSHMSSAGDVNTGKAWKPVRRPSDMNEYSRQIKELRALEKPGKAHGKVFVRVLGAKDLSVPMPSQSTLVTCTLNNGIHYVTTPECQLAVNSAVDQEFELIEHSKLEFTLTFKVKRDPHIISQYKALAPTPTVAPAPPPLVSVPSSSSTTKVGTSRGMFSMFSSSPKKPKEKYVAPPPKAPPPSQQPPPRLTENLARYLKPDGTLGRAFISFKDVANRCDSRLFETTFPLIGQKLEQGNRVTSLQIGEIALQMFRLPPLPGLPQDKLPQSLEECHRGLRHVNWHKMTYFEGTLTQNGGDCSSWRRRQFRIIGAKLVAFNDVTKRATATIDLKKVVAVEDDQPPSSLVSPRSTATGRGARDVDRYESLYGVERSFRLIFEDQGEIAFFADTDGEKAKWLEVLNALVGRIPPHPLWAEMLWQRQTDLNNQNSQRPIAQAAHSRGYTQ